MENIFQILFYYAGVISLMLGGYSLYMDKRARLNQLFSLLCLSTAVWGLGFSMAINAPDPEICLFWRRFAALGWGTLFAFLLHFSLVYTRNRVLLKHWWYALPIYIPAAITLTVFSFSSGISSGQYRLVRTELGWVNFAYNNPWDYFFNAYYIVYVLLTLLILLRYRKVSARKETDSQVKWIIISFLGTVVVGSLTDIAFNSTFKGSIPQLAPILMLVPVITVYYLIIQYGFMNPNKLYESDMILTKSSQQRVYSNLSVAFVAGSFLIYLVLYLMYGNWLEPVWPSLFVILIGLAIYLIRLLQISDKAKDMLLIAIIFLAIPYIILSFSNYGGVTVWASSFLFIIIALIFNRSMVLVVISVSIISTQVLLWIMKPEVPLVIDRADYIGRIGLLLINIWVAYYVNRIFISRMRRNAKQLSLQRFISEVSSDFINVNQSNIEEKINWVLRIVGKLFGIERINLLNTDTEQNVIVVSNIWNTDKQKEGSYHEYQFEKTDIDWLMQLLSSNESIYISDVDELPDKASGIRENLISENVQSLVAFPLIEKEKSITILQLVSTNPGRKWDEEEIRLLNIIANIFNDAYLKVDAEKEISYMAYYDQLTGLPNRRLFRDRLHQAVALAKRTEKIIGVVFVDLDFFKSINDTLGHEGGDMLLKIVSEKLAGVVRQSDTVSRFGGDEFLILINHINQQQDILTIAEKIMDVLKQPYYVEGQEFNLTTSVGIAMYPFDGTEMDTLIRNADIAMYKAKENGKNQYVICSAELKEEVMHKIKLTNSLYRALERNEFYLHYQPQVRLDTGCISGVEALIRWEHPELGNVPPSVFIPIAEQIGIIGDIGEWVLAEACRQNILWQKEGYLPVCMAVNVSASQLRNLNFMEQIQSILNETSLNPQYLEIEITESAAMSEATDVINLMNRIRKLGIIIAIDDFGTDYSSLSRLMELPIDKLKIDKKFVDSIEGSEKDRAIVRSIITLTRNLELKVIAEGVEEKAQLEFLKEELCDEVQGYYYYRPMSAKDLEVILQKRDAHMLLGEEEKNAGNS